MPTSFPFLLSVHSSISISFDYFFVFEEGSAFSFLIRIFYVFPTYTCCSVYIKRVRSFISKSLKIYFLQISISFKGWIYDAFGRYSYAFYLAGGLNASGVLIMFLINIFNTNEIHKLEAEHIIEDEVEQANSKVIEYTCFASSERIYYSTLSIPNAVSSVKSLNDVDRAAILKHGGSSLKRSGSRSKQRPQSCVLTPIRENSRDKRSSLYLKSVHPLEKSVSCIQLERKDKSKELLIPIVPKEEHKNKEKHVPNGNCKPAKGQAPKADFKIPIIQVEDGDLDKQLKEQYDTKEYQQQAPNNQYAIYPKELYKPLSKTTTNNKPADDKFQSYQLLSTINEHTFLNARVTSL